MLPKVAIVGRPNVGKSTLFNRIIGERLSITDDQPGVTRDRIYSKASWLSKEFFVIDTGGIEISDAPFQTEIKAQAEIAMEEADVIVFVVDCRSGVTDDDTFIAKLLYKTKKPVLLAVNKVDDQKFKENVYEFYSLGFGVPIPLSSSHGIGVGNLLDSVINHFPIEKVEEKLGIESDFETILNEIKVRDYKDSHREIAPLKIAKDAVLLDTTSLSFDEVCNKIINLIDKRMKEMEEKNTMENFEMKELKPRDLV